MGEERLEESPEAQGGRITQARVEKCLAPNFPGSLSTLPAVRTRVLCTDLQRGCDSTLSEHQACARMGLRSKVPSWASPPLDLPHSPEQVSTLRPGLSSSTHSQQEEEQAGEAAFPDLEGLEGGRDLSASSQLPATGASGRCGHLPASTCLLPPGPCLLFRESASLTLFTAPRPGMNTCPLPGRSHLPKPSFSPP